MDEMNSNELHTGKQLRGEREGRNEQRLIESSRRATMDAVRMVRA